MLAERREEPSRAIDEGRATRKPTAIAGGDPPAVFVGRAAELERVRRGLVDAPLALVLGLPGAGKRALARRVAAGWSGPVARHAVAPGDDARSVLRALGRALGLPGEAEPSSVIDLSARIDQRGALVVLEDADRLAEPDAIAAIAARLRRGRVLATGRMRREPPAEPERVELVLGGLSLDDARALWSRLDQLHGARAGFDEAWQRTAGNPLHLRRAHAGDLDQDPLAPAIAALAPAERRLALALALAGRPLPEGVVLGLIGERGGRASGERATGDHGDRGERATGDHGERVERATGDHGDRGDRATGDRGDHGDRGDRGERATGDRPTGDQGDRGDRAIGTRGDRATDDRGDRATGTRADRPTGDRGRGAAVRGLVARLLVEVLPGGALTAALLARPGLVAAAQPEERAALHGALGAIDDAGLGAADGACFRVEHLLAAGRRREARDLLVGRAADLARAGATAALVRGLDRVLDDASRDDDREARAVRARARARRLEIDRARRELAWPAARGEEAASPGDEARAVQAGLDLAALRLDDALRAARAGLAAPAVPAARRARFAAVRLLAATLRGDGEAARAEHPAAPVLARALSLWLEGRDRDAEHALREADASAGDPAALTGRAEGIARALLAGDAGHPGPIDAAVARLDDPLLVAAAGAAHALADERRGDLDAALDRAAAAEELFERGGHRLGALTCRLVRARSWLACGRVRAGGRLLDEVAAEAAVAGASLLVGLASRARRADPWTAITGNAPPEEMGGPRRAAVIALVRALGAGQVQVARGYLAAVGRAELDPLEAALVGVAASDLGARDLDRADLDGRGTGHADLDRVCGRAARAGADPELVPAVAAWLAGRRAARTAGTIREVVVDRASDQVRIDALVIDLARRPALRRLFYALLDAPGRTCDRAALARAIWSVDYRPLVHDGALWVNVKRLRALLAPIGLRVAACDDAIRLRIDDGRELRVV